MRLDALDATRTRRLIHQHPETGYLEIRTASTIYNALLELGLRPKAGQTLLPLHSHPGLPSQDEMDAACEAVLAGGVAPADVERFRNGATTVIVDIVGNRPGPTVGFRFDMDALPIEESRSRDHAPESNAFRSENPGVMHACGHDGHVAIGLRLAGLLASQPERTGIVRLIFQPAEEGVRGAAPIVDAGLCDDIDDFVAVHLGFGVPLNGLAVATDLFGTSKFEYVFEGSAAHASNSPEEGRNALLAAAHATIGLHSITQHSGAETRANVGHFVASGASNIVPGRAIVRAEVRASTSDALTNLERRADEVVTAAGAMFGVSTSVRRTGHAVAAESAADLYDEVARRAPRHGFNPVGHHAMFASDDATVMMHRVTERGGRAAYLLIGSGSFGAHHSSNFDLDERVLDRTADLLFSWLVG